jgi:predicted component of type VI protein secretion system
MTSRRGGVAAAFATTLIVGGCSSGYPTACQCPKPVAYDEATLKQISVELRALPPDNVLHRAMEDYENERDDLRFCGPTGR